MNYIITTDTHFGHKNIMDFGNRPKGFEELILENLEKKANHTNILIHLGDICWSNDRYWNRQLTSMPFKKKWLILGNHDKKSREWYINNGWDIASNRITVIYNNKLISFTHKPVMLLGEDINIHGHFHNINMERVKEKEPELYDIYQLPNHILLALEHHYTPFSLHHLIK
jgi:calcineurin-like phosphoesterase family protein